MRAIAFDIDDTIYDLARPFFQAWEELFAARYPLPENELFLKMRTYSDEAYELVLAGEKPMSYMHAYRLTRTLADYGLAVSEREALEFQRVYEGFQERICVSEPMAALLDSLAAAGAPFGFISNGDAAHQREKAARLSLGRWVVAERIVISGEVGAAKPAPEPFCVLKERLGVQEGCELWYAGDTYETDIAGAQAAGWSSIWYNHRSRTAPPGAPAPDITVGSEAALIACVRELMGV